MKVPGESGCHCKFKSRPAKNKRKKPIKIAFASQHVSQIFVKRVCSFVISS